MSVISLLVEKPMLNAGHWLINDFRAKNILQGMHYYFLHKRAEEPHIVLKTKIQFLLVNSTYQRLPLVKSIRNFGLSVNFLKFINIPNILSMPQIFPMNEGIRGEI